MCLQQCSPCSTVIVFSVAVVATIDYESPVTCAISISRGDGYSVFGCNKNDPFVDLPG